MESLLRLFPATLSPDIHVRRASEQELVRLEGQPGMLSASLQIVASPDADATNRISRAWDTSLPRGATESPHVPEDDKSVVRAALLPTIASVPPTLRVHVASALFSIVRSDFPAHWPTLLDEIVQRLTSGQEAEMYAGLRALLETVRAFRFSDTDTKLEQVVSRTFPVLLQMTNSLMDAPPSNLPAVGEMVYYTMKVYKTSLALTLTKHQQSNESIVPWGTLMLRIVQQPVNVDGDEETKEKAPWWKAKKWAFYALNRLFARYGIPSQLSASMKSCKPFAETFLHNFAPEILKAYLHTADAMVSQQQWVSRPVVRHLLTFFTECLKPKSMWLLLRPHMQQIIETLVYPRLCFSDEDEELWETDPVDFVRMRADPLGEMGTTSSVASALLHTAVARRTASMLEPTLQFILQVVHAYAAGQCTPRQMYGALRMCITICQSMVHHESVQHQLDEFFAQHVLPALQSPHAFLRLGACAAIQTFDHAGMKWTSSEHLEAAFRGVMECMMDTELPVRVQAAEAIGELVAHDEVHNAMAPNAGRLMQELLKLSDETDLDVLMTTQEKIVNHFAEELLPFSVQLTQQMAQSYMRLVQDNLAGGDTDADGVHTFRMDQGEEDKYFAAVGCLSTMYQMVTTAESRPEILAELEHVLLPVVAYTIESETIDLYDDCFQLTDVLTYYQKRISPGMWDIFTLMYKSFKSSGMDYLSEMIGTFDNCASYGTAVLQEKPEYRHMLLDIFHTAMTHDQLVVSDRVAACQIGEVILLLLRGYVDEAVPSMMATLLPFTQKSDEAPSFLLRKWAILVLLEAVYYNASLALQVLESHGATHAFFSAALPMLSKCRRVHECKVAIVALLSLLSLDPATVPETLQAGYPHLLGALVTQLALLPKLVAQRKELSKALDQGYDVDDEDGVLAEFDDDADVEEDDNDYLELLAQEAVRLRTRVSAVDEGGDLDDLDDLDDDDEMAYESPLEGVPVYEPFRTVVQQLRQNTALFQRLTEGLSEAQQRDMQQALELVDGEDTGTTVSS